MSNRIKDAGIEHIVVLMLENRGFDHVLGWLYDNHDTPQFVRKPEDNRPFIALSTLSPEELRRLANPSPISSQNPVEPIRGTRSPATPEFNPGEHFVHIMAQMWGKSRAEVNWADPDERAREIYSQYQQCNTVPMSGYLKDFAEVMTHEANATPTADNVVQILETYLPEQLPVLNGLAKHYAVSDEWFCSVPSQTNTNRAFSTAGTSRGLVTNNYFDAVNQPGFLTARPATAVLKAIADQKGSHADRLPQTTQSLFSLLSTFDVDWKLYWQSTWPPKGPLSGFKEIQYVRCMFPELDKPCYNNNFIKFDALDPNNTLFSAARNGTLPAVTWIEPKWGGGPVYRNGSATGLTAPALQKAKVALRIVGTDMHPSCDTTVAEDFMDNLYSALSQSPKWNKTLFIITFDENGGTYDHVPPPGSIPRSDKNDPPPPNWVPTPTGLDRTPPPGSTGGENQPNPVTKTEFGFQFDQLGIRVPTLLISPALPKNTVFRSQTAVPFDHTSLIATILDWRGIDRQYWCLGNRVDQAPTFETVFPTVPIEKRTDKRYAGSIRVARAPSENIFPKTEYRLKYIGNPWAPPPNPAMYLGVAEWSTIYRGYYPTMTNNVLDAASIQLIMDGLPNQVSAITNRSKVNIAYRNPPVTSGINLPNIALSDRYKNTFCSASDKKWNDVWEIRLMGSRDSEDLIQLNDCFCFFNAAYTSLESSVFDPYQRLVQDPDNPKYTTTLPGVWGAWQLEKK